MHSSLSLFHKGGVHDDLLEYQQLPLILQGFVLYYTRKRQSKTYLNHTYRTVIMIIHTILTSCAANSELWKHGLYFTPKDQKAIPKEVCYLLDLNAINYVFHLLFVVIVPHSEVIVGFLVLRLHLFSLDDCEKKN